MQNQTIPELYTDDNKSKYFSSSTNILKYSKNVHEKLYTKETTSRAGTTEFFRKITKRKKLSNEQLHLCEAKTNISKCYNILDEVTKSINS